MYNQILKTQDLSLYARDKQALYSRTKKQNDETVTQTFMMAMESGEYDAIRAAVYILSKPKLHSTAPRTLKFGYMQSDFYERALKSGGLEIAFSLLPRDMRVSLATQVIATQNNNYAGEIVKKSLGRKYDLSSPSLFPFLEKLKADDQAAAFLTVIHSRLTNAKRFEDEHVREAFYDLDRQVVQNFPSETQEIVCNSLFSGQQNKLNHQMPLLKSLNEKKILNSAISDVRNPGSVQVKPKKKI